MRPAFAADLKSFRLALGALGRRHRDFQNAIAERRGCICRIDAVWNWQTTIELAVASLAAIKAFTFLVALLFAFAFDRDAVVGDFYFDVVFGQARQVRAHHKFFIALKHFHLRCPQALRQVRTFCNWREPLVPKSKIVEQVLHLLTKAPHENEWRSRNFLRDLFAVATQQSSCLVRAVLFLRGIGSFCHHLSFLDYCFESESSCRL